MQENVTVLSLSSLFAEGKITEGLQLRLETIETYAQHYRQDLEAAKVTSVVLGIVGLALSANPLVGVLGGCGLIGYGYTLCKDFQLTKRFCPIPLLRKGTGELLTGIGLAATNQDQEDDDPLLNVIGYIDPDLAHEYELLMVAEGQITGYLFNLPSDQRTNAYQHILRHTKLRNSLKLPPLHEVSAAIAFGTPHQKAIASSSPASSDVESMPDPEPTIDVQAEVVNEDRVDAPTSDIQDAGAIPPVVKSPAKEVRREIFVKLFDFNRLRTEPDKFAHLRIIGGTGIGKTTFADWLLDVLGGDRFVITPKKKSWNWVGLKVYGLWFDYETIREKLQWIHSEMYRRYPLMEGGQRFGITNFVVDEWRLINTNVKVIRERDPDSGKSIEVAPSAKAMMKDIITVARESMLRLIALAQGENVASWGFEGESDLEECFTDIRLGEFAIDYAKSLRNQCRKDSDDYEYWTTVLHELEWQSNQCTREGKSLPCCMVGKVPARIPDLSNWRREIPITAKNTSVCLHNSPQVEFNKFDADELIDELNWNQMILGLTEDEINHLIEQKRSKSVSPKQEAPDTTDTLGDTATEGVSIPKMHTEQRIDGSSDTPDTELDTPDTDTYQAENFAQDFPESTESEIFARIKDTNLPPGRFIKEELKITNGERNKLARKAVGYLVRKYGNFRLMEKFKEYL